MSRTLADLPLGPRLACERLCDELVALLGTELVSLWVYGAVTQPDRPKRLGDVDTHGIVRHVPPSDVRVAIDELHTSTAREFDIEWDSWYILESDARSATPPGHALQPQLVDESWALHRAHWLKGAYVSLHGVEAENLVPMPAWAELVAALRSELQFIDRLLQNSSVSAAEMAYCVCNSCRILHSLSSRDVVVSKREAAQWAMLNGPSMWQPAIEAALRVYDGEQTTSDSAPLNSNGLLVVEAARSSFSRA